MNEPTLESLADDADAAFSSVLPGFARTNRNVDSGWGARDGFRLVYEQGEKRCEVLYSDMAIEVTMNGKELFGWAVHPDFAGNAFSRENLGKAISRIALSALRSQHGA